MAKQKYFDGYWSAKQPIAKEAVTIRKQIIKDGSGVKGADIDTLPAGVKLLIDLAENALGWTRIIQVNGKLPGFISNQNKPEQDREGWLDNSAYKLIEQPDPEPEPTGRKWRYLITVEEIADS